jgi:hypothetical protein
MFIGNDLFNTSINMAAGSWDNMLLPLDTDTPFPNLKKSCFPMAIFKEYKKSYDAYELKKRPAGSVKEPEFLSMHEIARTWTGMAARLP